MLPSETGAPVPRRKIGGRTRWKERQAKKRGRTEVRPFSSNVRLNYLRLRRRRSAAPTSPEPSSSMLAGSGTSLPVSVAPVEPPAARIRRSGSPVVPLVTSKSCVCGLATSGPNHAACRCGGSISVTSGIIVHVQLIAGTVRQCRRPGGLAAPHFPTVRLVVATVLLSAPPSWNTQPVGALSCWMPASCTPSAIRPTNCTGQDRQRSRTCPAPACTSNHR